MTSTNLLYTLNTLDFLTCSLTLPLLPPHMKYLGSSFFSIGLTISLYIAINLISDVYIEKWSRANGHYAALKKLLPVCAVLYCLLGPIKSIFFITFFRSAIGMFEHNLKHGRALLSSKFTIKQLEDFDKGFQNVRLITLLTIQIFTAHLREMARGFEYACYLTAIGYVMSYVILHNYVSPDKPQKKSGTEVSSTSQIIKNISKVLSNNWLLYWDVVTIKFLFEFVFIAHLTSFAPILILVYNTKPKWVGYTFALQVAAEAFSTHSSGWLNQRYIHDRNYMSRTKHGFFLLLFAVTCFYLADTWEKIVLCLLPLYLSFFMLRKGTSELFRRNVLHGSPADSEKAVAIIAHISAPIVTCLIYDMFDSFGVSMIKIFASGLATFIIFFIFNPKETTEKKD